MIPVTYQNDVSKLGDISKPGRILICLEVNPPHGTDFMTIVERLKGKVDHIDFLNITDSALARMKFAALPFASLLKHHLNVEPLVNLSCRDRNIVALQGDLLAGWATGIRSIVALTGDAMSVGDSPDLKGVFEINSVGLLDLVQKLNRGVDFAGKELGGSPSFVSGVVVNPNAKNTGAEIRRLEKKYKAGACYALSQPVFDAEAAIAFLKGAQYIGIPIFLGLLPFKTIRSALAVAKQVPGIRLSASLEERFKDSPDEDCSAFFIEHCISIASQTKDYVRGFHVISGATPKLALKFSKKLFETLNS